MSSDHPDEPPQSGGPASEPAPEQPARPPLAHILLGKPRDPHDRQLFHRLSLIPFLAWIGLGADGLSSSAYGPEEAFRALGDHTYLAVPLALLTAVTVVVISACYMRIIEAFPHGGGGYLVATKLLGEKAGVVAGSALLVDYVLTITVSVAAAGNALFSLLPVGSQPWKLWAEVVAIGFLTLINLRGVRESILVLVPIFMTFILTHVALILSGCIVHAGDLPTEAGRLAQSFRSDLAAPAFGLAGMIALFLRAYSLGGGTYTGIEAVSNGLSVMRAPQVQTGKRTMVYMAASLSFTAAGLILCYLLAGIRPTEGQTMNAVLANDILNKCIPASPALRTFLLYLTLCAEGALLVIASQAGFIGGPRVMANMALDSWLPHRFAALSDRFTTSNGIVLMAATSLAALFYTEGDVRALLVIYSINVFLTFALAQFGMIRYWWRNRWKKIGRRRLALFITGFVFCATILGVTIYEKFLEGGWVTLAVTGILVAGCLRVKSYYRKVGRMIGQIQADLDVVKEEGAVPPPFDPNLPTAALLVNAYSGLGIHTVLKILQIFPGYFKNFHFISTGTIDLGNFKGTEELESLEKSTKKNLEKYITLVNGLGLAAKYSYSIGTDAVAELEQLCIQVGQTHRTPVFFSGKILFEREKWYHILFHNMTAYALQKRLQWAGIMMVILPVRIFDKPVKPS